MVTMASYYGYDDTNSRWSGRLATSRPLGKRSEPFCREAANRERRSRERLTCLAWRVAICISRQTLEWRYSHLGFQVSFASSWLQRRNVLIPLRLNLLNVCVYLHHLRSKFVYFVRKLFLTMILSESWRPQAAEKKKQKLVSVSSQYWERSSPVTVFYVTNICVVTLLTRTKPLIGSFT